MDNVRAVKIQSVLFKINKIVSVTVLFFIVPLCRKIQYKNYG